MALRQDPYTLPIMRELLECMKKELSAAGGPGLCDIGLVPGDSPPPVVDCGDPDSPYTEACGGRGWVRLIREFPSSQLPVVEANATWETGLAAEIEIGVVRCVHVFGDDQGNPPTNEALEEDVEQQLSDKAAMYRALRCCLEEGEREPEFVVGQYAVTGGGGIGGGTWTAIVRVK